MKRHELVLFTLATAGWLSACDPKDDDITGVESYVGYAVTHADRESGGAAIALLGPEGEIVKKRYVHSGTVIDGLDSALTTDLALPTQPGAPGVLTYIERYQTDLITSIEVDSGELLGQVLTHEEDDDTGYSSNPYDIAYIDEDTAWVTRFAPNQSPDAAKINRGNDLLKVNPGTMERTGTRISLDKLNTKGTVTDEESGEESEVTIYARPSQVVHIDGYLVVGLARLSAGFDAIGEGMVALVDLEDGNKVSGFALEGFTNCGSVVPVRGEAAQVIVACTGFYRGDQRAEAGLVILKLEDGELSVEETFRVEDDDDAPLAVSQVASLGDSRVVAVYNGNGDDRGDAAYIVDIASGDYRRIARSEDSYVLGSGYYLLDQEVFLLPDASEVGLRRFDLSGEKPMELSVLKTDKSLPPTAVGPLR